MVKVVAEDFDSLPHMERFSTGLERPIPVSTSVQV